jgi:hypothetical protein
MAAKTRNGEYRKIKGHKYIVTRQILFDMVDQCYAIISKLECGKIILCSKI